MLNATVRPDIVVKFNDSKKTFKSSSNETIYPLLVNGATYLPLRSIAELANIEVAWDGKTSTISMKQDLADNANSYLTKIQTLSTEIDTLKKQNEDLQARLANYEGSKVPKDYKKGTFKITTGNEGKTLFKTFVNYWGPNKPFVSNGQVYSGNDVIGVSSVGNVGLYSYDNLSYNTVLKFENPGGLYSELYFDTLPDDTMVDSKLKGFLIVKTLSGTYKFLQNEEDYTYANGRLTMNISNYSEVSFVLIPNTVDDSNRVTCRVTPTGGIYSWPKEGHTTSKESLVIIVGPYVK